MKFFGIAPNCLEYLVQDRDKWREVVKRGTIEEKRTIKSNIFLSKLYHNEIDKSKIKLELFRCFKIYQNYFLNVQKKN